MDLSDVQCRLATTIGLEARSLGPTLIRKAIERRMAARRLDDFYVYLALIEAESGEFQELVEEVVVGESWFFRHPRAFEVLRAHALANLASSSASYRVLSLPGAGGEEPYSIAMTLLELGYAATRVVVDAGDISQRALERARTAIYGVRSLRAVDAGRRARFFLETASGAQVRPEVRNQVRFVIANILQPGPLPFEGPYQAIFCRNLLIYLTPEARQTVIRGLHERLDRNGLLFVGHAEQLGELDTDFEALAERGAFAYRRRGPAAPGRPAIADAARSRPLPSMPAPRASRPTVGGRNPAPPIRPGPSAKAHSVREPAEDPLVRASDLASRSEYGAAEEACRKALLTQAPRAAAYHLLGMILQATGRYTESEQALERAVYLEGDHEDALMALALLARKRGDRQSAERYTQRATRAHQRGSQP
jgi:chemotaxis protein methyltransferase WspC